MSVQFEPHKVIQAILSDFYEVFNWKYIGLYH